MMFHLGTGDSISAVMGGAKTTTEPTVLMRLRNGGVVRSAAFPLTDTTAVVLASGPQGQNELNIESIFVANVDSVSQTITLSCTIGGVTVNFAVLTLAAGDMATITDLGVITVTNSSGQAKQSTVAGGSPVVLSGTADAIPPHASGDYFVTGAAADLMTIAAPTAGTDDDKVIRVISTTAYAHTITFTGSTLNDGSTTQLTATFAAHPGASLTFVAYQGKWYTLAQIQITFS